MDTGTAPAGDGPEEVGGRLQRVSCSQCGRELVFSGPRPLFCGFCGKPFAKTEPETAVVPQTGPEAPTLAPFTPAMPEIGPEPQVVGGYRLLRRLGGGGMGTVYEAEDPAGRRVALKLILGGQPGSDDTLERFRREGRLASGIAHPRCVFVLAADEDAGRPYIVMELMPGETLADLLHKRGPLPPAEAVAKIVDVLDGLREAHRLGVVHRDVKPSNCFLDADGRVKVGDFGLSRSLAADAHLTRTGSFLGTPLFASPEQVRGEPPGPQSDVYSLAATLYCLLTGRAPFEGSGDAASTLARIVADPVPPMLTVRPGLPPALDRVVLRGLERDRHRRWRDLDEFREALLPFLPGKQDAARRSVRFAALLVDWIILKAVATVAQVVGVATGLLSLDPYEAQHRAPGTFAVGVVLWAVYFIFPERFWGCTPGKRLLRLRVCTLAGGEPPGWGRTALRFAVFFALLFPGSTLLGPLIFRVDVDSREGRARARELSTAIFPLEVIGVVLLLSTMRRRNGWRGLHEFASGTRVIQLPEPVRRRASIPRSFGGALSRSENLPGRVGPFHVRGALRWDEGSRVLLGEDQSLGRSVLLWLRHASEDPLCPKRRACARSTRLRWLSAGQQDGWLWDAFPAPAGQPLAELVAAGGPLRWSEARPVLEYLSEELGASADEGTLPVRLTVGQVWVQTDGSALLLDEPTGREEGAIEDGDPDQRALELLRQSAVLALEGPRRSDPADRPHVRATVPEHASRILDRLLDRAKPYRNVAEFREDLEATRSRPAEVSADRRTAHLVVQTALLFFGLCWMMMAAWLTDIPTLLVLETTDRLGTRALQPLEASAAAGLVAGGAAQSPLPYAAAAYQSGADLELADQLRKVLREEQRERQEREEGADWLNQAVMRGLVQFIHGVEVEINRSHPEVPHGDDFRAEAAVRIREDQSIAAVDHVMLVVALVTIAVCPTLCVLSALFFRGGVSYPLMGLSLVRADGRRAGRFRCAWRSLLVWAPLVFVLAAAVLLREWYWASAADRAGRVWMLWAVEVLRWASLGLLAVYPVLAVRSPERTPADRLAGTWLVPR
jgi:uncharacterized RDD family membrane protein YckC